MKIYNSIIILFILILFTTVACNTKKDDAAAQETIVSPDSAAVIDPNAAATLTAAAGSELHYKCPKNCKGSGGNEKGTCPVCGSEYVHNQAFHNQAPGAPGSPTSPITIDPNVGVTTGTTNPAIATPSSATPGSTTAGARTAEPAQNAKGVWHFLCSKTCGGGGGAQGNCPKCGSPLVHNQAYHQQ